MTPASTSQKPRLRIGIFSRYNITDQFDLAAEFEGMLNELAQDADILHLSLRGPRSPRQVSNHVRIEELSPCIDRNSQKDIFLKSVLMYLMLPAVALRFRKFMPDLIFLSEVLPLFGLWLKRLCGTKVATAYGDWHVHNILGNKRFLRPFLKVVECIDRFETRRLDGLFCRAMAAGARLQKRGIPPSRISIVRDAPDLTAFHPSDEQELRKACGFNERDVVLLYHGVMHQGKGVDMLLQWTSELYDEGLPVGLILVGSGPEEQKLRQMAETLSLGSRAVFTGWLQTIKEVGRYCNAADICVAMRTADEANARVVPGALLHSMACGKVVIGPRLEGICEIIREKENGFTFEADNGDDFKRLIRWLIEHREVWPQAGQNACQDILKHYSVATAARRYAEAICHFATVSK